MHVHAHALRMMGMQNALEDPILVFNEEHVMPVMAWHDQIPSCQMACPHGQIARTVPHKTNKLASMVEESSLHTCLCLLGAGYSKKVKGLIIRT